MNKTQIDFYQRLARGITAQFGSHCEVVVHDLESKDLDHSIVAIENGHVSGRSIGDGPSHIVLQALHDGDHASGDRLAYLTCTRDGKVLKSSTIYIRNDKGKPIGIFAINYDISLMNAAAEQINSFIGIPQTEESPAEPITMNVADLLDELIAQSARSIGKPVALMTKDDKISIIRSLNDTGAFLITKSGPKVCEFLGISKYTLYTYLDEIKSAQQETKSDE
ncbi:MAG: transcriptional regulator [Lachnospiraceae bacterium]|nr:transcriptional regulator [Lachnospiraceae bacterium]